MLKARILTAVLMVVLLYLATVYLSPFYFGLALALVFIPALLEWSGFMGLQSFSGKCLYLLLFYSLLCVTGFALGVSPSAAAIHENLVTAIMIASFAFWLFAFYAVLRYPRAVTLWQGRMRIGLMGLFCMLPTWVGLLQLKYLADSGYLVLALIALVSIVDIGAFFVGSAWGNKKLAPELSPKKSWAGFWGGMVSCVSLSVLLIGLLHFYLQPLSGGQLLFLFVIALVVASISVIGDLYESMLKRHQGVKDSGSSLPGHGGILDRVDSLMAATPVFVLTIMYLLPQVQWY